MSGDEMVVVECISYSLFLLVIFHGTYIDSI